MWLQACDSHIYLYILIVMNNQVVSLNSALRNGFVPLQGAHLSATDYFFAYMIPDWYVLPWFYIVTFNLDAMIMVLISTYITVPILMKWLIMPMIEHEWSRVYSPSVMFVVSGWLGYQIRIITAELAYYYLYQT
jgi:hypothetical protein